MLVHLQRAEPPLQLVARVTTIGEDVQQPWPPVANGFQQIGSTIAVLDIGTVHHEADHQTKCINDDMTLAAFGFLSRVIAPDTTAFRGFGGPQGMFGIETVMDEIAMTLGKDPLEVRKLNLYKDPAISGTPDTMTTQYNQLIEDWVGDKVIAQVEPVWNETMEEEGRLAYRSVFGGRLRHLEEVALLTYATPRQPNLALLPELEALNIPVHRVGDAKWAREPMSATAEGYAVGMAL